MRFYLLGNHPMVILGGAGSQIAISFSLVACDYGLKVDSNRSKSKFPSCAHVGFLSETNCGWRVFALKYVLLPGSCEHFVDYLSGCRFRSTIFPPSLGPGKICHGSCTEPSHLDQRVKAHLRISDHRRGGSCARCACYDDSQAANGRLPGSEYRTVHPVNGMESRILAREHCFSCRRELPILGG